MFPANARILTCPHCQGKKEVMQLLSGNTFGAELWSDSKEDAPMLPQVSYVQKCPHCGKYFLMSSQATRETGDDWSMELGELTYDEMKEALGIFHNSSAYCMIPKTELSWRLTLLWVANDHYGRKGLELPEEDRELIWDNIRRLIPRVKDTLLKAELKREIGLFDEAIQTLENHNFSSEWEQEIARGIITHAKDKDTKVFKLR